MNKILLNSVLCTNVNTSKDHCYTEENLYKFVFLKIAKKEMK